MHCRRATRVRSDHRRGPLVTGTVGLISSSDSGGAPGQSPVSLRAAASEVPRLALASFKSFNPPQFRLPGVTVRRWESRPISLSVRDWVTRVLPSI
eukprot:59526-Hanusia_phi.AAC.1